VTFSRGGNASFPFPEKPGGDSGPQPAEQKEPADNQAY
jgi:hypothetical protein